MMGLVAVTNDETPHVDREFCVLLHDYYHALIDELSQDFDCFNGAAYLSSTPTFTAKVGERVRWRVGALGREFHAFHIHAHRWRCPGSAGGAYTDTVAIGPSMAVDFDYLEDNPGEWLYHCHVTDHMMGGMVGYYKVTA